MGRIVKTSIMHPLLQALIGLEITAVILAAFLYLPAAEGFEVPGAARMIVFHVPCAMVAVLAYLVSTVYAIAYLVRRDMANDIKSSASASLGFLFTVLATVTGMIFAHIQWGAAWNWDPRETSILMLLIVYAAYFALRSALPNQSARARISAVYNILACLVMPFFVFVLPRIGPGGLHPTTTLTDRGSLSQEYHIVLRAAMLGYVVLYLWMFRLAVRIGEIQSARRMK